MKVTQEGAELVIRIQLDSPRMSSTGKTYIVAYDVDARSGVQVDGKPVKVQVTATIPAN